MQYSSSKEDYKNELRWDQLLCIPICFVFENQVVHDQILWKKQDCSPALIKQFSLIWLRDNFFRLISQKRRLQATKHRYALFTQPKFSSFDCLDITDENDFTTRVTAETIESKLLY